MRRYFIFLFLILFFLPSNSEGYNNLGTSARATGMGAFVGVADEPCGVFYNPAGLSQLKNMQLSFLYAKRTKHGFAENENPYLFSGVSTFWFSKKLTVGIAGLQKGSWSEPTGIVTNNIGLVTLSYELSSKVSFGINNKFLYNSNFGKKKGYDFDLGILYHPFNKFSLGLVGEDILAEDMTNDNKVVFDYPTREMKLGFAYKVGTEKKSTLLAFDLILKEKTKPKTKHYNLYSFGLEEWFSNFGFRLGYTFGKEFGKDFGQPSFGFSLKIKGENTIRLDYSFQKYPYDNAKMTTGDHRIGLTYIFGNFKKPIFEKRPKPQKEKIQKPVFSKKKASYIPGWLRFDLNVEIENLSFDQDNLVVFFFEPKLDLDVRSWKLLFVREKPKDWKDIGDVLVKTEEGIGPPPFSLLWDLKDENFQKVEKGKYFFSLVLYDRQNQRWASDWKGFKVK